MTKSAFVLVDYENVQPKDLGGLKESAYKILIFVGASQTKLPSKLVRVKDELASQAEYIWIEGSGKNALDFHVAYYLGKLAAAHPEATLHVVSKDKGFDPLMKYLKNSGMSCDRVASVSAIPVSVKSKRLSIRPAVVNPKRELSPIESVIENLRKRGKAKPRTRTKLLGTIKSILGRQTSDEDAVRLLDQLRSCGVTESGSGKISYAAEF